VKKSFKKKVIYHDSCYLGRRGDGIYESPRNVIKACRAQLLEFELSKENSTCCGGARAIADYMPHLYTEVAREKIKLQAKPLGAEVIAVACPSCYSNFSEAIKGFENIEVKHILEIFLDATRVENG
jgi:Fe-S oxidoreductase